MSGGVYVHVRYPWDATFNPRARGPSGYYSALIKQALRYGMPAKRFGYIGARVAERGVPVRLLTRAWRLLPRSPSAETDDLLARVGERWDELASNSGRLPSQSGALSALALTRSSGRTVFVFDADGTPLLVCKIPRQDASGVDAEARSLERARGAAIAPAYLGRIGAARVQEALPGTPLLPPPIRPGNARSLRWPVELQGMAEAMVRLAERTAHPAVPQELFGPVQEALESENLSPRLQRTLAGCVSDLRRHPVAVLRHGDTSAHNCLTHQGKFVGLVDWEWSRIDGAPGFDTINAAIAYLDHGVGLLRWSERRALDAFRAAWGSSFFTEARTAARRSAAAAGLPDGLFDCVERVLFLRRLGARMEDPDRFATGAKCALSMLEFVCAE